MTTKTTVKTNKLKSKPVATTKKTVAKKSVKCSKAYTNMFQAYNAFWKRGFTDWKGTSSRSEFWLATLFNCILILVPIFLILFFWAIGVRESGIITFFMVILCLVALYGVAILVPTLSMGIRRFHDFGQPAWLFLILFVSSFVLSVAELDFISNVISTITFVLCSLPTKLLDNPYHKYNK